MCYPFDSLCATHLTKPVCSLGNLDGLVGYVNSDYAADLDKWRSLIGYVFTIGGCDVS